MVSTVAFSRVKQRWTKSEKKPEIDSGIFMHSMMPVEYLYHDIIFEISDQHRVRSSGPQRNVDSTDIMLCTTTTQRGICLTLMEIQYHLQFFASVRHVWISFAKNVICTEQMHIRQKK